LVLGGCDEDGNDAFNDLSEICLQASEELKVIDPKINLRVNKNTPLSLYERGTRLTKQGLGFPQYSNDDVVIPGLVKLGYDLKDARNYAVAACWEFIISGCGADYPNIGVMNFPLAVERATKKLASCKDFEEFKALVKEEIEFIEVACLSRTEMFLWGEVSPYAAIPPFVEAFHATSPQTGEYAATPSFFAASSFFSRVSR
jgi:formate C-acetyltransferase